MRKASKLGGWGVGGWGGGGELSRGSLPNIATGEINDAEGLTICNPTIGGSFKAFIGDGDF